MCERRFESYLSITTKQMFSQTIACYENSKKIMEEIFEPPSSEAILKNKKSQELLHKVRDL